MGHITDQYGPYYRPTPNLSLGRGAPIGSPIRLISPISPIRLISPINPTPPPMGGPRGASRIKQTHQTYPMPGAPS